MSTPPLPEAASPRCSTSCCPYARGAGVDARWLVIEGDERFFAITKRLHNHLYGVAGDGGPLGEDEHRHYEAVLRDNAAELASAVRPGDIVVLHDPQPAGLAAAMHQRGARVVWRCHVGTDATNERTEEGWEFLRRYLEPPVAEAYVFSRRGFAPSWAPDDMTHAIPPSIDPFSPKNQELSNDQVHAILGAVGVLGCQHATADYRRPDGTTRRIEHGADIVRTGPPPGPDVPIVVQISRWDRLKDMVGVLDGFADFVVGDGGTQLRPRGTGRDRGRRRSRGSSGLPGVLGAVAPAPSPCPTEDRPRLPAHG